ncbi:MAG: HlyC/CorC family transporter [Nitrospirae bacterium]|nr:HlyC/CorC family transporter [Nitrospirota bacterium]
MFEAMIILGLIIANGFFACAEIAIISSHKGRIKQLAEEGNDEARHVANMHADPDRFLATVQVGITVVGATAAALGGATASDRLAPVLTTHLPESLVPFSEMIALSLAVVAISYLSLVVGELVPKAIAMRYPDQIALALGRTMHGISRLAYPLARILSGSTGLLLKLLRIDMVRANPMATEEDIKLLLREGREKGEIEPGEQELIHSVFEFTDTSVREVMVPRPRMHTLEVQTSLKEVFNFIAEKMHARYPVYDGDKVVGILNYKDLMQLMLDPERAGGIRKLLHPPYFVPETMKVLRLLKEMQRRHVQMAMVVNEYGDVSGMVTVVDLLEEIVGDIRDEYDTEDKSVQRMRDGSLVVDADTAIYDLHEDYQLDIPDSPDYETLGGFMLSQLQGIPHGGEMVHYAQYKFTIVDMDGVRIAKVKIDQPPQKVA